MPFSIFTRQAIEYRRTAREAEAGRLTNILLAASADGEEVTGPLGGATVDALQEFNAQIRRYNDSERAEDKENALADMKAILRDIDAAFRESDFARNQFYQGFEKEAHRRLQKAQMQLHPVAPTELSFDDVLNQMSAEIVSKLGALLSQGHRLNTDWFNHLYRELVIPNPNLRISVAQAKEKLENIQHLRQFVSEHANEASFLDEMMIELRMSDEIRQENMLDFAINRVNYAEQLAEFEQLEQSMLERGPDLLREKLQDLLSQSKGQLFQAILNPHQRSDDDVRYQVDEIINNVRDINANAEAHQQALQSLQNTLNHLDSGTKWHNWLFSRKMGHKAQLIRDAIVEIPISILTNLKEHEGDPRVQNLYQALKFRRWGNQVDEAAAADNPEAHSRSYQELKAELDGIRHRGAERDMANINPFENIDSQGDDLEDGARIDPSGRP